MAQPPAALSVEATLAEVLDDSEEAALRVQYTQTLCGWVTCGRKKPTKQWRTQVRLPWTEPNAASSSP